MSSNGSTMTVDEAEIRPVNAIKIEGVPRETITVPIIGTAPLIVNQFTAKAKQAMLDAQQGRKPVKVARDPQQEYEAAAYRLDDGGYGFPAIGFKQAICGASRFFGKDVTNVLLRQCVFVEGAYSANVQQKLVPIVGTPRMREDYVRFGVGSTDLRYRPEFPDWSALLIITYALNSFSRSSIVSFVEAAGMGGVGEFRPAGKKSTGEFGTFAVNVDLPVERIIL